MSQQENLEIVQRGYKAFTEGTRSSTRLPRIWKRLLKAAVEVIKFRDEMPAS
jgi:hypothetical protein